MKALCIVSHREHLPENGFKDYEAGKEYDLDNADPALFQTEKPAARAAIKSKAAEG